MWLEKEEQNKWALHQCNIGNDTEEIRDLIDIPLYCYIYYTKIKKNSKVKKRIPRKSFIEFSEAEFINNVTDQNQKKIARKEIDVIDAEEDLLKALSKVSKNSIIKCINGWSKEAKVSIPVSISENKKSLLWKAATILFFIRLEIVKKCG